MSTDPEDAARDVDPGVATHEVRLDETGHLAESLPCRACGYDLKGSAADGTCPECAAPVERSIRGDLLRFCDPAWLERLALGLLVIACGIFGGILLQIGTMIAAVLASIVATTSGAFGVMTIVMVTAGLVTTIVALVNVIGAWLVTTQDPAGTETEASPSARTVARFAIIASLVASPMQMLMGQAGTYFGGGGAGAGPRTLDIVLILVTLTTAVLAMVGWVAFYAYTRQLALRAPLPRYARQLRIIMWGYAISTTLSLGTGFTSMLLMTTGRLVPTNMSGAMAATAISLTFGSCASVIAFMLFEAWAGVLFLLLRKRLAVMVAEARKSGR